MFTNYFTSPNVMGQRRLYHFQPMLFKNIYFLLTFTTKQSIPVAFLAFLCPAKINICNFNEPML